MSLSRDTVLGAAAVVVACAYYAEAARIQQSLLADAVGADGVPRALAFAMGAVGLMLAGRGVLQAKAAAGDDLPMSAHVRAAGLLGIVIAYMLILPVAGYPLSVAGLIAAVAAYAGARPGLPLAAAALGGAALLWLMFHSLLGVSMPMGLLTWG